MLGVRCQVELSRPRKEDSIVCESPGHCHTTSLAARRDGTGRLLKWSDSLLVEVTARGNVVYFYSKAKCIREMLRGLHSYICHWWNRTVYRDPSQKGSHKNQGEAISLQHLKTTHFRSPFSGNKMLYLPWGLFIYVYEGMKSPANKEVRAKQAMQNSPWSKSEYDSCHSAFLYLSYQQAAPRMTCGYCHVAAVTPAPRG